MSMVIYHRSTRIIVTAVCFLMATFAWGAVFYGHSVYMDVLTRDMGWSTAVVSTGILVFWITSLPGTIGVGLLIDRHGPVPVVTIGALCIGLGLIALGQVTEAWQMFVVYAILGFGYPALAAVTIGPTLAPWFDRGFGIALGVALTGASFGGALVPMILVYSIARNGLEATMLVAGSTVLVMLALAVTVLARLGRPKPISKAGTVVPAIPAKIMLKDPLFWRIAAAAALGLGGQVGFLAHQIPIVSILAEPGAAATTVTVVALASAVGRLVVAQASRTVPATLLAAGSYALFGVGMAVLALADSFLTIQVGCAIAGLVVGPIVLLPPILARQAFGSARYGRTYAMVNVVMYVLAALAPWIVGILRDLSGDYIGGLWILFLLEILAIALIVKPIPNRLINS
jgi:MFS family permease